MFPNTVSISAIICPPEPLITFFLAIPCSQYDLVQEQSIFYNGGEERTVGGDQALFSFLSAHSHSSCLKGPTYTFWYFYRLPGMLGVLEVATERKLEYAVLLYYPQP